MTNNRENTPDKTGPDWINFMIDEQEDTWAQMISWKFNIKVWWRNFQTSKQIDSHIHFYDVGITEAQDFSVLQDATQLDTGVTHFAAPL